MKTSAKSRQALRIAGLPVGEYGENGCYAHVGCKFEETEHIITKITVTDDLPGLYGNLERVRVWVDDRVIMECPLHNLESVTYVLENIQ